MTVLDLPPDPVERGASTLFLRVVDRFDGAAVETRAQLWRLDEPGNEHWRAGDRLVSRVEVPPEGLAIEELAEGTYRVRVHAQRADASDDPPPFAVRGRWTAVDVAIATPPVTPAWLVVFDERGRRIENGESYPENWSGRRAEVPEPSWVRPRETRERFRILPIGGGAGGTYGGRFGGRGCKRWRAVRAGAYGFLLGGYAGDARDIRWTWPHRLRFGTVEVRATVLGSHPPGQRRYVAVVPDREALLDRIVLPDGRSARAIESRVRVTVDARPAAELPATEPWRHVPIEVSIVHPELAPFRATFTLARGLPEQRLSWRAADDGGG